MLQAGPGRVDQHDAATAVAGVLFEKPTQRIEHDWERTTRRDHFEQPLFTGKQSFSPPLVVDVGRQGIPEDDAPFRIPQGETACVEPAVDPVGAAAASLAFVWMAGFERRLPRGEDTRAVIRMIAVDLPPALQFLERRAEIVQAVAVGVYEIAVRIHEDNEGRKAIEDQTKTTLVRAHGFYIGVYSAPFDGLSGCVG